MCGIENYVILSGLLGFIIGDSGYALRRYLMTPFINPTTDAEERFNSALTTMRAKIECTFGILKNRFQCLMQPLRVVGPERSGDVAYLFQMLILFEGGARTAREPMR